MTEFKEQSDSVFDINQALLKVQHELEPACKDRKNDFFKSKYADMNAVWDACRDLLNENALLIDHRVTGEHGSMYVVTTVTHVPSGQWKASRMPLLLDKANMQGLGSAVSYSKRYNLMVLVNVNSDDDDGNKASGNDKKAKVTQIADVDVEARMNSFLASHDKSEHETIRDFIIKYAKYKEISVSQALDDYHDKEVFQKNYTTWKAKRKVA